MKERELRLPFPLLWGTLCILRAMQHWELILFFFAIAFIYSSVGFGGGSSYLAVLAVYQLPVYEMKLTGLICNIIVVTGGSILFIRNKQADLKKMLPIVALSVPLAFAGALLKISADTFFVLLGASLVLAGSLLLLRTQETDKPVADKPVLSAVVGGAIGFLSGMVSIGGGIFLSPVLHLMRWDVPKKIAATASVFILVNSVAGLIGQLSKQPAGPVQYYRIALLGIAVFLGGQLGSRAGIKKFEPATIRKVTAVLVLAAGIEVLVKHAHI